MIAELFFPEGTSIVRGQSGNLPKRVQEWLTLSGPIHTAIDGDFGPATAAAVIAFQKARGLTPTGEVDYGTWVELTRPLREATELQKWAARPLREIVCLVAKQHLASHPREVGGDNRGPWVRYYCNGNDGEMWYWCAGFVSRVLEQACRIKGCATPITVSLSCDELAASAKKHDCLVKADHPSVVPGSIFLIRKAAGDWHHTGILMARGDGHMTTIEGNTNDDGSRNGYEVCARTRDFANKDFILL